MNGVIYGNTGRVYKENELLVKNAIRMIDLNSVINSGGVMTESDYSDENIMTMLELLDKLSKKEENEQ